MTVSAVVCIACGPLWIRPASFPWFREGRRLDFIIDLPGTNPIAGIVP